MSTVPGELQAIVDLAVERSLRKYPLHGGAGEEPVDVDWPDASREVGRPTLNFLRDLHLLEVNTDDLRWYKTTPPDKQAITAGVSNFAKIAVPGISLTGLVSGLVTYLQGWSKTGAAEWIFMGCGTLLLCVTAVAVALIIKADLSARAFSTAAQYEARAQCAAAFLGMVSPSPHLASGRGKGALTG